MSGACSPLRLISSPYFFGRIKILNMKINKKEDNTNKWLTLTVNFNVWSILDLHTHTESKIRNYVK